MITGESHEASLLVLEYHEGISVARNIYQNSSQVVLFQELHLDRTRTSVILIGTSHLTEVQNWGLKLTPDVHACRW